LKAPNSKFIDGRPDPFRSVPTALIDIAKTDRSRRFVRSMSARGHAFPTILVTILFAERSQNSVECYSE